MGYPEGDMEELSDAYLIAARVFSLDLPPVQLDMSIAALASSRVSLRRRRGCADAVSAGHSVVPQKSCLLFVGEKLALFRPLCFSLRLLSLSARAHGCVRFSALPLECPVDIQSGAVAK